MAEPRVDGRFFGTATRTADTPGSFSTAALDVTGGDGPVLANYSNENVDSLDGKLDGLNQITITLWVNLQEDPRNLDRIFSTGANGPGFRIVEPVGENGGAMSAANFSFGLDSADGFNPSYVNVDADRKWVFLAVIFDGTVWDDMVQFYVGGETDEAALVNSIASNARNVSTTVDNHLRLGRHPDLAHRQINGFIDDFRIYRGVAGAEVIEEIRLENLNSGAVASGFEDWRKQQFSESQLQDSSISGPAADPDGDGVANLLEYALGGQPLASSTDLLPEPEVQTVEAGNGSRDYLVFTFYQPEAASDLTYIVESSATLQEWSADAVLVDSAPVEGGTEETYHAPAPLSDSSRTFLRLRVEQK